MLSNNKFLIHILLYSPLVSILFNSALIFIIYEILGFICSFILVIWFALLCYLKSIIVSWGRCWRCLHLPKSLRIWLHSSWLRPVVGAVIQGLEVWTQAHCVLRTGQMCNRLIHYRDKAAAWLAWAVLCDGQKLCSGRLWSLTRDGLLVSWLPRPA